MNEKLSALMDGELSRDEAHKVIKNLGSDAVRREEWDAYHLIGACMRGEVVESEVKSDRCTQAILARLAEEPTVLAPAALQRNPVTERRTRMALAMAASVVTISAVGVVALKQQQGASVAPVQLVQQVAPQPVSTIAGSAAQRKEAEVRVNDYLVVHRQYANPGAFQPASLTQGGLPRDPDAPRQATGR
jgi:sigma-E factor negative regulatory protein RseA